MYGKNLNLHYMSKYWQRNDTTWKQLKPVNMVIETSLNKPIVINNCDLTMSNIISYQLYNGITDATMQVDVKYNVIS